MTSTFKETLLDLVPSLRAFAFCLTQNRIEADAATDPVRTISNERYEEDCHG